MSVPNISNTNLEYFDGFEDYSISQANRYWNNVVVNGNMSISSSNGRNSSSSLRCTASSAFSPNYVSIVLTNQATRTIGFAIKISAIPAFTVTILSVYDGGTNQYDLRINTSGTLSVTRNGTVLGTTTFTFSVNIFYYIELSVTINSSSGVVTLKSNNNVILSLTSQNTQNTSNAYASAINFGLPVVGGTFSMTVDFDDLYIRKDSTFLGDIRVESKLPNANGSTNQWTPLSGSNFTNVADNPADDNTSYNSTATVGNIDLFSYPALASTSGTIYAVMLCLVAEIDTSGVGQIQPVYRVSSTNYTGPTSYPSSSSYNAFPDIQGQNLGTSAAWTFSDITSTQFGLERTA